MKVNFFWFRRDLRLDDNAGLFHSLKDGLPVQCVFIFDTEILEKLENKNDRRVVFIHRYLEKLNSELKKYGATLLIRHGRPEEIWKKIITEYNVNEVFTNHDYEPYGKSRDEKIKNLLGKKGINLKTFKDQVIFEKKEVIKSDGTPYTVYTPYMKAWRRKVNHFYKSSYPVELYLKNLKKEKSIPVLRLKDIGFHETKDIFPSEELDPSVLENYFLQRDFPSLRGTSRLSVHFRFGTISIRKLMREGWKNEKWINELIWREFYMSILWFFPRVTDRPFKTKYEHLKWRNDEEEFQRWCDGNTGYPIVDAGMRELNETGFMHNRVRMITAMFLTKYLLIDWRWGETYFAEKLLDYELASNNGGWQWSAGTGVDAAPYFRIFNMDEQTRRFDPELKYISKWVPEFSEPTYPKPMVDYKMAKERCLEFYVGVH